MLKRRRKDKIREAVHEELLFQIKGLLEIELGNQVFSKGKFANLDIHFEICNGIDIYIFDKEFSYVNEYNCLEFHDWTKLLDIDEPIEDFSMIGHYHSDDLLYLLLHFEEEKKKMLDRINTYIDWRKDFK